MWAIEAARLLLKELITTTESVVESVFRYAAYAKLIKQSEQIHKKSLLNIEDRLKSASTA